MAGRSSQYRKYANHGADGGLGEQDTGRGPVSPGPAPLAYAMVVGASANSRGYSVGSAYGTLDPLDIAGLEIGQWTADGATGAGLFFLSGNLQIPGITIIRVNVVTDAYGPVQDYVWNGTFGYENSDPPFGTFMNIKNGLPVDFEVTQVP